MVEALNRVMDFYGATAKAIVWEHNTHIGDARATDMAEDNMVNVGQLLRDELRKMRFLRLDQARTEVVSSLQTLGKPR